MPKGVYLIIAGIAIGAVGGVLYAVAAGALFGSMADWSQNPGSADTGPFGEATGFMIAAYAMMAVGSVLFMIGLIMLAMDL